MSDEPVFEFETDCDAEELLNKAKQAAFRKGYDVDEQDDNSITFSDSEYSLEVDDGKVKLQGNNPDALSAYKNYLQGKL